MAASNSEWRMYWSSLRPAEDRGFVAHVREFGAGEPDGLPRDQVQVDIRRERFAARVHLEDRLAAGKIRSGDEHLPVEASGAEKSGVEILEPVRRAHDDDALRRLEAVELDEQLVQRLILL